MKFNYDRQMTVADVEECLSDKCHIGLGFRVELEASS